jgi:hypothetical protein
VPLQFLYFFASLEYNTTKASVSINMWPKRYKDYPVDEPLLKEKVEPGKGIIGCQMHELNGWGEAYHALPDPKKSLRFQLLERIIGEKNDAQL